MSGGTWEAMTTAERLDRTALAAEAAVLSGSFRHEAELIRGIDPIGARRCYDLSRALERYAFVLDDLTLTPDVSQVRGIVEAADLVRQQLEGSRRFLRAAAAVDEYLTRAAARRR